MSKSLKYFLRPSRSYQNLRPYQKNMWTFWFIFFSIYVFLLFKWDLQKYFLGLFHEKSRDFKNIFFKSPDKNPKFLKNIFQGLHREKMWSFLFIF